MSGYLPELAGFQCGLTMELSLLTVDRLGTDFGATTDFNAEGGQTAIFANFVIEILNQRSTCYGNTRCPYKYGHTRHRTMAV